MNATIYACRDKSWDGVWGDYMATLDAFNETLTDLDDTPTYSAYASFLPSAAEDDGDSAPIVGWIVGNSYHHISEHHRGCRPSWPDRSAVNPGANPHRGADVLSGEATRIGLRLAAHQHWTPAASCTPCAPAT
ncbi:MAG: hypothetical protein R2838_09015 [Caldilineaceae bacterium]